MTTGSDADHAPYTGGGLDGAGFGVVVDPETNVWVGNFGFSGTGCATPGKGNTLSELSSSGDPLSPSAGYIQGAIDGPQGMAVDQDGNLCIVNFHGSSVTEYRGGSPGRAVNFTNGKILRATSG